MVNMIPGIKFQYLIEQDSEDSEEENTRSSTLTAFSTSSVDSLSSIDSISEDDLAVPVPSTSPARAVDLTSPIPSTSSMLPMIPEPSTSAIPQMSPVHPTSPVPSTSRGSQENYYNYRSEAARRSSFRNWPASFINPASLAAVGFYYTGEIDRVKCFECQVEISHWAEGHIPMKIHEMCSPMCKFIHNERCNNVSIGASSDIVLRIRRRNRNISHPYSLQYKESFDFNDHQYLRYIRNPTTYELSRLGLKRVQKPENLEYSSYESRLNSFVTWPTYMTQTSEKLADAGFYYTGIDDYTICYYCGVRIGYWRPGEDPWEQHAIMSSNCSYLLTVQGWEYVNNVTGQDLYESSAKAPIGITVENPARSNSQNDTSEMTLVQENATLKEEIRAMKDARLCKVCMAREAKITFVPCGHLATCRACSRAFTKCIICRRKIETVIHTFVD